ncbi:GNAT family N-acetyltransferase [Pseudoteredinibacter isoporae]|uniref:N-acetylglutamate synthase-like GNAT family acetyltransferase n=1 Tax=Pseudoteredinibacter isoporae TaxID=570281 RepID=A0A7X0MX95_9GAMM|nr:GNAT family N-acetyltransferase [Pseudoteredinibacter isoporae]MBB6523248.1 N-acetylglutamate synthase-like GNAT family acetyltransferase [Pseudoteredinibacter isoporae]NHO88764.1 GNAT family N-acetyltransferase [Pseudoteredinibacter isoporae]NIB22545.1 GNAT family N-acetyltransferase [Pseudoteredinibacter isoporae]
MDVYEADPRDLKDINRIVIAAKRHWGYPEEWIQQWLPDLTVNESVLEERPFWLLKSEGSTLAVASCASLGEGLYELEDCWVDPACMGLGAGKKLLEFVLSHLQELSAKELLIAADPNATGFYEKMGAEACGFRDSTPEGRKLPLYKVVF